MKKIALILLFVLVLSIAGCGKEENLPVSENSVLLDNIYYFVNPTVDIRVYKENLGEKHGEALNVFIKFHSDNVIEWIDKVWVKNNEPCRYDKYYGIYELNGKSLTITLSGEDPVLCVVHDDGESITLGSGKFVYFDEYKLSDNETILTQFD